MKKTLMIICAFISLTVTSLYAHEINNLEGRLNSYVLLAVGMRNYVTPHDYEQTYLPLKRLATIAKIDCRTYGPLSETTHRAILELTNFVKNHQKEFSQLWEVESFFDIAQDLMSLTESFLRDLK